MGAVCLEQVFRGDVYVIKILLGCYGQLLHNFLGRDVKLSPHAVLPYQALHCGIGVAISTGAALTEVHTD